MSRFGKVATGSSRALGIDVKVSSIEAISVASRTLTRRQRLRIVQQVESLLKGPCRKNTGERVAGAKVLVALLPESLQMIERSLQRTEDRWCYELHFSLFCFLGFAQTLSPSMCQKIYRVVQTYLETARRDTAMAAWMAGDLLGDHWSGHHILPDLARLALNAAFAAGRKGALHGIEHRLQHPGEPRKEKSAVLKTLFAISTSDRSPAVRRYASRLMSRRGNPNRRPSALPR